MKGVGVVYAVHLEHPALYPLKAVFQSQVQHAPLPDIKAPELFSGADMICKLRDQERFPDLRRTGKNIHTDTQQGFYDRRLAAIADLVQLRQ